MRAIFILFTLSFLFAQISAGPANCTEWCNVIFSSAFTNVCGANPDFADETACQNYCTGVNMTMGDDTDTGVNTIGCRVYHANFAVTTATPNNIHCNHATQTGGGVCGSYCDVYCSVVMNGACAGMYKDLSDCQTACATYPTDGVDIDLSNTTNWGDHVQCRIYHAGAPAISSPTIHCPHAYVTGGKVCVSNNDYCVGYCRMFYSSCSNMIPPAYDSVKNCVALCEGYATVAPSSYMDQTGYLPTDNSIAVASDSVDCRTYHSIAAISAPSLHCAHASIDGGNVCGTECGVYCNLRNMANGICGSQITVTATGCSSDCASLNTGGNYYTSTGDDTLQCRVYHWSAVFALNDTEHCPHGNVVGSTTCVGTAPVAPVAPVAPTPVTPSPSSGIVSVTGILSLSIICLLGLLL